MSAVKPSLSWWKAGRAIALAVAAGVLLGTFGPFGTYESMPPLERYTFWLACMLAGTCIHLPAYHAGQMIGESRGLSAWIWVPAAAAAAAVPMTFMVNGIAASMFSGGSIDGVVGLYPFVLAVSLPVLAVVHLANRQSAEAPVPANPEAPPVLAPETATPAQAADVKSETTPLLDAIPIRFGREILCVQMEDHYLRVHTAVGDTMLYGRMADLELELKGRVEGQRVHRSWWVARAAVTGWTREDKTLTLTLSNGLQVPVARDRQPEVKAAGWLV